MQSARGITAEGRRRLHDSCTGLGFSVWPSRCQFKGGGPCHPEAWCTHCWYASPCGGKIALTACALCGIALHEAQPCPCVEARQLFRCRAVIRMECAACQPAAVVLKPLCLM